MPEKLETTKTQETVRENTAETLPAKEPTEVGEEATRSIDIAAEGVIKQGESQLSGGLKSIGEDSPELLDSGKEITKTFSGKINDLKNSFTRKILTVITPIIIAHGVEAQNPPQPKSEPVRAENYGMLTKPSSNYPRLKEVYYLDGGNYKFQHYEDEKGNSVDPEDYYRHQAEIAKLKDEAKDDYPKRYVEEMKRQAEYSNSHIKETEEKALKSLEEALKDAQFNVRLFKDTEDSTRFLNEQARIEKRIAEIKANPNILIEKIDEQELQKSGEWFQEQAKIQLAQYDAIEQGQKKASEIKEKVEGERSWVEHNVSSKEYHDRLIKEGGTEEQYKERLIQAKTIPIEITSKPHDYYGSSEYNPETNKVTVIAGDEIKNPEGTHEIEHGITHGDSGMTEYAKKLLTESFTSSNMTNDEKNQSKNMFAPDGKSHVFDRPSERYVRREVLEQDLEDLGVWKYGQKFTEVEYQKALELQKAGKLSRNADQFLRMTKPEKILDVMNTIASIEEDQSEESKV